MSRIIRERRDFFVYDTTVIEPGQEEVYLMRDHSSTDLRKTNVQDNRRLDYGFTAQIRCIGLTHLGKRDVALLDFLTVTLFIGDLPQIYIPGNACSTVQKPLGFCLHRCFEVPSRQSFSLRLDASEMLPHAIRVRATLYGSFYRDQA